MNSTLLADVDLGWLGGGAGLGPWAGITSISDAVVAFTNVWSKLIFGFLTICAGLWFIMQMIWGAYEFLYAGAEAERVQKGKKRIQNAIIGLVIVVAAYALVSLFGTMLGLDILNPADIIILLRP